MIQAPFHLIKHSFASNFVILFISNGQTSNFGSTSTDVEE
ncbi:hypothetical protein AC564_3190c [Lacticaseibacillus paracasei]|nr:hypothetical protein AC564_3190c [Lacticaseibacillus paracasei]